MTTYCTTSDANSVSRISIIFLIDPLFRMKSNSIPITIAILASRSTLASTLGLATRDLKPSTKYPSDWKYLGCYSDSVSARVLDGYYSVSDKNQSGEQCVKLCAGLGYPFAGTGE